MPDSNVSLPENELPIDLRNPYTAGLLAWLLPGLGHYYQRRYPKALIFFLCIMPTFLVGCALASGPEVGIARNIYWSWRWKKGDTRAWWLAQASLGPAAIPSVLQAWRINSGQPPMFGQFMAPPQLHHGDASGVPPVLDVVRQKLPHYELANYLVVIAGLMNLLVIFDAIGGPFIGLVAKAKPEHLSRAAQARNESP